MRISAYPPDSTEDCKDNPEVSGGKDGSRARCYCTMALGFGHNQQQKPRYKAHKTPKVPKTGREQREYGARPSGQAGGCQARDRLTRPLVALVALRNTVII